MASSPQGTGTGVQRILLAVTDRSSGDFLASPEIAVTATLRNENGSPMEKEEGEFLWAVPETSGVYVFEFEFPEPETYQVTLESEEWGELGPAGVIALSDPGVVAIGEKAPRSETRTTATEPLSAITSDPHPDPRFYEMTVAEAIDKGASVVVFSSFVACPREACGTLLDQVKELADEFSSLGYVHVDVYEDVTGADEEALLVPSVAEWGLPSEPWVFVVDGAGIVADRFEGVASDDELRAAMTSAKSSENTDG